MSGTLCELSGSEMVPGIPALRGTQGPRDLRPQHVPRSFGASIANWGGLTPLSTQVNILGGHLVYFNELCRCTPAPPRRSQLPPSWGRFFALRKRDGGTLVGDGAPCGGD
jgi:hypothetical protein